MEKINVQVDKDAISKALEVLELATLNPFEDLAKADLQGKSEEAPKSKDNQQNDIENGKKEDKEEGEEGEEGKLNQNKVKEDEESKNNSENIKKAVIEEINDSLSEKIDNLTKGYTELENLYKSQVDEITKSFTEINNSLSEEIKNLKEQISKGFESTTIKFQAVGELEKGIMDKVDNKFDLLTERLKFLEQKPEPRKSIISTEQIKDRSFDIEKAENSGKKILSISKNKKEILNMLVNIDNPAQLNQQYAQAVQEFEASKTIEKSIQTELFNDGIVIIN
jgi:hypothetical protein